MELETLAELALRADMEAKEAKDRADDLKKQLKEALEEHEMLNPATHGIGHVRLIVKPINRFDESLARELMKPEELAPFEKTVLDAAKLKNEVAPSVYQLMQKNFGYSLELKVGD